MRNTESQGRRVFLHVWPRSQAAFTFYYMQLCTDRRAIMMMVKLGVSMETPAEHWGGSRTSGNTEAVRAGLLQAEHVWETRVWCHKCSTLSKRNSAEKLRLHVPAPSRRNAFIMFVCFISELWYTAANVHSRGFVALKENGVHLQSRAAHVYTDRLRLQRLLFCRITEMLLAIILPLCWKSVLDMFFFNYSDNKPPSFSHGWKTWSQKCVFIIYEAQ